MTSPHPTAAPRPKIAVVGCGHGELDIIYRNLELECQAKGWTLSELDLLIICGDFQAFRNTLDLNCASIPRRYRRLADFPAYYTGRSTAPVLTLVIGGNHEASNYLFELYHGGWLAPNIYYLGAAGVIRYGPWRIAGLSGIYAEDDYRRPHGERLPYDRDCVRSVYHVREYDVAKLLQVTGQVDVGLSHDWPMWAELFGDCDSLYRMKPHFLHSATVGGLGSKPALEVLGCLKPRYWFSGHMHTRFSAKVEHKSQDIEDTIRELPVSGTLKTKLPIFKRQPSSRGSSICAQEASGTTEFLALSKAGHSSFSYMALLELDLPAHPDEAQYLGKKDDGKFALHYDEEWLAITRAFNDTLRIPDPDTLILPPEKQGKKVSSATIAQNKKWVKENITDRGLLKVPLNFERHAPIHDASLGDAGGQPPEYPNVQTAQLAELLQMTDRFAVQDETEEYQSDAGIDFVEFAD